ncbi:hypothetical protein COC42_12105 [Sphingomonas spermidinifaciens]|uniref:DUF11 domain-containing protein n=1 Tax=Sphingomonas spermidinifaciens TaxID=1141889 RepID=A0A2A4B388_9SPHN|nr:hypothetical protein [Sphingomonas spermidinifaciens]PCD02198.1 hypothetical protein COC42_12105 [Sphingomonas spermidinifaciens]
MKISRSLWRSIALLLIVVGATGAQAQRIDNVAVAEWQDGGRRSIESNLVSIERAEAVSLKTYRLSSTAATTTDIRASLCGGRPLPVAQTGATGSGVASVAQTTSLRAGEQLLFSLKAAAANVDRGAVDQISAVLVTTSGDRETLTVYETGVDTGVFVGAIETRTIPPQPVPSDCVLSVAAGDRIAVECQRSGNQRTLATASLDVLADPFGFVFDAGDGTPVDGARVTLIDDTTGQPATVFAADGRTSWPSSVMTGVPIVDGAGGSNEMLPGEFRFPLVREGSYRLVVFPPAPYSAPSSAAPAALATLRRPDGHPFAIAEGSYGRSFVLTGTAPLNIDVPVDRPAVATTITKTASRAVASPGDPIRYEIVVRNPDNRVKREIVVRDTPSPVLRLRPDSIRIDGIAAPDAVTIDADGRGLTLRLDAIAANASRRITYVMTIRADAPAGQAVNSVRAVDPRGVTSETNAVVRVERDVVTARMTIVGTVTAGACDVAGIRKGIAGVRVQLEDGSYAITDRDGRYHFDAVLPGTHVVRGDAATLSGGRFIDCTRSTRSMGMGATRLVTGRGGSLVTANFQALPGTRAAAPDPAGAAPSDAAAAGAEIDWLALPGEEAGFLFPLTDHNPRAPAIRVAVRHPVGSKVALTAGGKPVDPIAFDGTRTATGGIWAVSLWRGVAIGEGRTTVSAQILASDGRPPQTFVRDVHFAGATFAATLVPARSALIADGVRPVTLAIRLTDRDGQPVRAGTTGELSLSAPYELAAEHDAEDARMLSGLDRVRPTWHVDGDDGIAHVTLAPTSVSGAITLGFVFHDGETVRRQTIEAWLDAGATGWTLVGLAEGSIGAARVTERMDPLQGGTNDADGRVALYAKGRILGRWLLTVAYDSANVRDEQRLTGAIDSNAYYTVYADRSDRRFDAASTRKLYLRLEARAFRALFGDFETGMTDTLLARYVRAATGLKAEYRAGGVAASAFAARISTRHRRDEIQGNGLSGPYRLSARRIVANSESVVIEVRDRLRSERIVSQRAMTRFVDYDVDLLTGTIRFSAPVQSRTHDLDPQFIVVDYEVDELGGGAVNGGGRASWTGRGDRVRIGASVISDADDEGRTTIAAADLRVRPRADTELRAEMAASRADDETATAWSVEAEHHGRVIDMLAYARSIGARYGAQQQNVAERGRGKVGIDSRVRLADDLMLTASGWTDRSLTDDGRRIAGRMRIDWKTDLSDLRIGLTLADDRLADGRTARSTLLDLGATRRLLANRLEIDASSALPIGNDESIDFPARHRLGARYSISRGVRLAGTVEIAKGDAIDATTARLGVDLTPWTGGRANAALADQVIGELGHRAFANYGLAQSFQIGSAWTVDATVDATSTLGGIAADRVVNPGHPVASGGQLGDGLLTEDFVAVTLGAAYRAGRWSATGRGEVRRADFADRMGLTLGVIRQLGEGSVLGGLFTWTKAAAAGDATTEIANIAVSGARRPSSSPVALLFRIEYRADRITGAVIGEAAAAGRTAWLVNGDAASERLLGSLSLDWAPAGRDDKGRFQRSEVSLFLAGRYVTERVEAIDIEGLSMLAGLDARMGLGSKVELGFGATARGEPRGRVDYAIGPFVGFSPASNLLLTLGYNLVGFSDRDFSSMRAVRAGPFAKIRIVFDPESFEWLGGRQ